MKRVSLLLVVLIAFTLLLVKETEISAHPAAAATPACGVIGTNTTFTLAASPYDICAGGITVLSGFTLTVQPGVTLQFEPGYSDKLTVAGTLNALGTATQPILFTGVTPSPGSWAGIYASGAPAALANVNLDYVTVEFGGLAGTSAAEIYGYYAALTVARSTVRNSASNGILAEYNATYDIQSTSFTENVNDAIRLNTPTQDLLMSGLSASGNGTNTVHILGTTHLPGQRRWANPGIPYLIDAPVGNNPGETLAIDPGVQLVFSPGGYIQIGGQLTASGSASAPILMTGQTASPGSWRGIVILGGTIPASAQLDYVTVEYGGNDVAGADIYVSNGQLIAHHSIVRSSSKDGVRFDSHAGGSFLAGQIYGNALYGVFNAPTNGGVLATNNWWGDPGGPRSDVAACPSGLGDKVTAGVFYLPVVTAVNATAQFPLSALPQIALSPRRWFTPADGTPDYIDITLTNGNGAPIPGRTVRLATTLGTVVDGGITDVNGKALAIVSSNPTTGDATLTASLDATTGCEGVIPTTSQVTFTPPLAITDLLPNAPASYFGSNISVSPQPVVTNVLTTINVQLTNPLSTPVTVDVDFGFVQSGIGLAFGPIKTITGQVIPANTSVPLSASFVPTVSGHYCVQVSYTITAVGGAPLVAPHAPLKNFEDLNLNVQQSTTSPKAKGDGLAKTRTSLKNVNRFVGRAYDNSIVVPLAVANAGIEWDLNNAEKISNALQGDPPRQDYNIISLPVKLILPPVVAGNGLSAARAAAMNDLDSALADANAAGVAAGIALDRYGGASAAGDLSWASTQNGVMQEYERQMGVDLINAASKIDALIAVANTEGQTSLVITAADVTNMQAHLAGGFTAQEIADAHAVGLTDADLAVILNNILTANPNDLSGDIFNSMRAIRDQFNNLGLVLQNPYTFNPPVVVAGSAVAGAQPATNSMAQVYPTVMTFPLANPNTTGTTPTLFTLKARRLNLPADWTVDVSPAQVSLAPGAQTTITVTVGAGSPTRQGSLPRLAVEAYDGTTLIGGITFDILVPYYAPFDGKLRIYLPDVIR